MMTRLLIDLAAAGEIDGMLLGMLEVRINADRLAKISLGPLFHHVKCGLVAEINLPGPEVPSFAGRVGVRNRRCSLGWDEK